jgi:NADPH-dependent curcumin reductase CurA
MKNLQVRIKTPPNGSCSADNFELIETEIPAPGKGEMLCRNKWLSLDPLNGGQLSTPGTGHLLPAQAVSEVIDSRNDVFNAGDVVVMEAGAQGYCVSTGVRVHRVRTGSAPVSAALGIMGDPGFAAYCGLLEVARIRQGETVVVSRAAGAVGAAAGQIARIKGCRVIGIAQGRAQSEWCVREAHFSACIDARAETLSERLRQLAPRGIDVFMSPPGDDVVDAVVSGDHLTVNGRVVRCMPDAGSVANTTVKVLRVDVGVHERRREAFFRDVIAWFAEGHLRYREDVVDGLHNVPTHFCRVLRGENFGRALVKA